MHPSIFGAISDAKELSYSKWTVAIVGLAATGISLASQQIIPLLVFAFTLRSAGPFSAFLFSLIWDKTSRLAALASIIAGTVVGFAVQFSAFPIYFGDYKLDPIIPGALASLVTFLVIHYIDRARGKLTGDTFTPVYEEATP